MDTITKLQEILLLHDKDYGRQLLSGRGNTLIYANDVIKALEETWATAIEECKTIVLKKFLVAKENNIVIDSKYVQKAFIIGMDELKQSVKDNK